MVRLPLQVERIIDLALEEDVGQGDVTSNATLPRDLAGRGHLLAKQEMVLAGADVAIRVFEKMGLSCHFEREDGMQVKPGVTLGWVEGPVGLLLSAERTALNFLQRLSGVATMTHRCVAALCQGGAHTRLLDTRKTTPGWRWLEKRAVLSGGGNNHRYNLSDGILIKDNHVAACGSIGEAVRRARRVSHPLLKIEVEVSDLSGLEEAIDGGADMVLLDNMDDVAVAEAVRVTDGRVLLEASGNMTLERLPRIAATGVDYVSMGALTHSAPSVDISLELERSSQ